MQGQGALSRGLRTIVTVMTFLKVWSTGRQQWESVKNAESQGLARLEESESVLYHMSGDLCTH